MLSVVVVTSLFCFFLFFVRQENIPAETIQVDMTVDPADGAAAAILESGPRFPAADAVGFTNPVISDP